jgi:hypothetical protein
VADVDVGADTGRVPGFHRVCMRRAVGSDDHIDTGGIMKRFIPATVLGALLVGAMAPASSQQLQQPTPLAPEPATQGNGMGPQVNNPQATPPQVPSDPNQRPALSSPIPNAGPATQLPAKPAVPQSATTVPTPPKTVPDPATQPTQGLIETAPGHFYDPATGRYYRKAPASKPG